MQFLTPLGLLGGLIAIPIILLYMLRLRRREIPVSSTFLWQQIIQDNEANTPWQRLRRNILLLLQLLILLALILALSRPFINVPAVGSGQIVLLLDASASMNATDETGGITRFEAAQQKALEVVNTLGAADSLTIVRVADVPEVIAPASNDRIVLANAINNAQPSNASADWEGALTLAIGGAADATEFNVVIISDGGLGDPALLPDVPGEVKYEPVGNSNENVAITALATRARAGQSPQLFTQITNYGGTDAEIVYSLDVDGELFVSNFYTVPAGEELQLVSEQLPERFAILEASLTIPTNSTLPDYVTADNQAWAVASDVTDRRALLMSPSNLFVMQALRSLPGVDGFPGNIDLGLPGQPFDLYILDRWLPAQLPDGDLLIINPPSSTAFFTVGPDRPAPSDITVNSNDPRVRFVDFDSVSISRYQAISEVEWATPLVAADDGSPLVLAGEVDGRQVAIFTFDIHNSDLPLQIAWPVLMANLLDWFAPQNLITIPNSLTVGDPLVVRPPLTASRIVVSLPDGTRSELPIERQTVVFADTDQPGIYQLAVQEGTSVLQSQPFAVNLFDPQESDITPQSSLSIGTRTITPGEREEIGQFEFWPLAALLALLILLLEWYVYWRRLRTPRQMRPIVPSAVSRRLSAFRE